MTDPDHTLLADGSIRRENPADSKQESFKHLPGCAHVQNMARPRSQRLIGPKCECREHYAGIEKLKKWLESDEGKKAIDKITPADSELTPTVTGAPQRAHFLDDEDA